MKACTAFNCMLFFPCSAHRPADKKHAYSSGLTALHVRLLAAQVATAEYSAAAQAAARCVELLPQHPPGYFYLAKTQAGLNNLAAAHKTLHRGLAAANGVGSEVHTIEMTYNLAMCSVEWLSSEERLLGRPPTPGALAAVAELGALAQQAQQVVARLPRALPPAWVEAARACQRAVDAQARDHAGRAPRPGAGGTVHKGISRAYSNQSMPRCARCGKHGLAMKRCARCMAVHYCR